MPSQKVPGLALWTFHTGLDRSQFDELSGAGADELGQRKRIAGRVGDGYVALFAAENAGLVAWATAQNTHYNASGGE
eukprot:SAG22_NODE_4876_length_1144_cov_1.330144_2_plen_77_part_00